MMQLIKTERVMATQVFSIEINGFSRVFPTLNEVRTYVDGLKAKGYVKSGDKAVIYPGTEHKGKTDTAYCFKNGSRTVVVS